MAALDLAVERRVVGNGEGGGGGQLDGSDAFVDGRSDDAADSGQWETMRLTWLSLYPHLVEGRAGNDGYLVKVVTYVEVDLVTEELVLVESPSELRLKTWGGEVDH